MTLNSYMLDYIKLVNTIGKLNRKYHNDLSNFLKSKDVNELNSQEVMMLIEIYHAREKQKDIRTTDLAVQGSYVVQHLFFHLNRLEKKNLITLKANSNQSSLSVNITEVGLSFIESIKVINMKKKEISSLHSQMETFLSTSVV